MTLFARAYAKDERSPRELYLLNIVFAIGAGIIYEDKRRTDSAGLTVQKPIIPAGQKEPEEYHSAAMQHLESLLGSMPASDHAGTGGGLEELQAVLLLAGFALLRPVGKWNDLFTWSIVRKTIIIPWLLPYRASTQYSTVKSLLEFPPVRLDYDSACRVLFPFKLRAIS